MSTWGIGTSLFKTGRSYEECKEDSARDPRHSGGFIARSVTLSLHSPRLEGDLRDRIVGIVRLDVLNTCPKKEGYYEINRQLHHAFNMTTLEALHNLDVSCKYEPILPEGTGIAISEDIVLTAGHVVRVANPKFYRVVQFNVDADKRLPQHQVYEIEDYVGCRYGTEPPDITVSIYQANLEGGDWAILKLKQKLKGVSGSLPIADDPKIFTRGCKVTTIGHPHGLPLRATAGIIDSPFPAGQANPIVVRYIAETLPGMSGGPVFDNNTGHLLGLHLRGRFQLDRPSRGGHQLCVYELTPLHPEISQHGLVGEFFQSIFPVMQRIAPIPIKAPISAEEKDKQIEAMQRKVEELQNLRRQTLSPIAFGSADWEKYFGNIGAEPPLPSDIAALLESPCPFWPPKKIHETHLLVLVPSTVNDQPFTLNLLEQLIQSPHANGHATKYKHYPEKTKAQFGSQQISHSHWILMTRGVLEWTRGKSWKDQQAGLTSKAPLGYAPPRALEAATAILMEYVKTGNRLYSNSPDTCTRCLELVDRKWPLLVGGFAPGGLEIYDGSYDSLEYGCLGVLRNFMEEGKRIEQAEKEKLAALEVANQKTKEAEKKDQELKEKNRQMEEMRIQQTKEEERKNQELRKLKEQAERKSEELKEKNRQIEEIRIQQKKEEERKNQELRRLKEAAEEEHKVVLEMQQRLSPVPAPAVVSPARASQSLPSIAFGVADWNKYFGDVGAEPPLPPDINTLLESPCPFWPDKRVCETHLLTLIPATVNGKPFTLDLLEQLIQHPRGGGHATKYGCYDECIKTCFGKNSSSSSYWVLMTRNILQGTLNKTWDNQQAVLARYVHLGYEPPCVLEAATGILMKYVKTGNRLYAHRSIEIRTRCQEGIEGRRDMYGNARCPLVVGNFVSPGDEYLKEGLWISYSYWNQGIESDGLSALRKLSTLPSMALSESAERSESNRAGAKKTRKSSPQPSSPAPGQCKQQ